MTTTTTTIAAPARTRRLTGLKPTGRLQLGNLLGAIRPLVAAQRHADSVVMIVDLHALTVEHQPDRIRELTREHATLLLAAGVDPQHTILYVQSQLPEHAQLHYLLECTTGYGEAARMIQFRSIHSRERSAGSDPVRLSLLTYPVLMAADVLLHDTDEVPVGEDQAQHLELARDVAYRFNTRYGRTFTVPRGVTEPVASRVMDLSDPAVKMGKSNTVTSGVIGLLDPPELVHRKVMRALTDPSETVRRDPDRQPGVTNLLDVHRACTGQDEGFGSYRELKEATAEAIIGTLAPIQQRYRELAADPRHLDQVLQVGAERARPRAAATLRRAAVAIGLL